MQRRRRRLSRLTGGGALALAALMLLAQPTAAGPKPKPKTPACADLASRLPKSATATLVAATPTVPAYCQVDVVPERDIHVRIALPLSAADRGVGGKVSGAWNGRVINQGGSGYAGIIGTPVFAVQRGEVGSHTDTGHNAAWCDAINPKTGKPNAQPNCGLAGGGFVLPPGGKLSTSQVRDFINRSLYVQTTWALKLTKTYYGKEARRNYWAGASTGGRQGWEMAQRYGDLFDGYLIGYPAMNWNRFIIAEAWPAVVVNDLLGPGGLSPAKSDAANAAAVAACDDLDGVRDGVIAEPRRCDFDARKVPGLSAQEAKAVNMIWDGPTDAKGKRLWGGITRGTSFGTLLPGGTGMGALIETYVRYWLYEDATFDWRSRLTIRNFPEAFAHSQRKFAKTAATDDTDLSDVRRARAKIVYYVTTNDPLIVPFGSYNYQQRLFDRYGVKGVRENVRTFYFPNVAHTEPTLTGPASAQTQLFDALQTWTEGGPAPTSFRQLDRGTGVQRTICAYPDLALATTCKPITKVPSDLAAASRTAHDPR
ncbi:tannase/feruloyl esterase family alpha/beta hydrolase [Actinocorallia sp. A-T 12471]|uniref:tannase/feruloyl esterase family alpha/beta hydrolase n=1 Tax=Actinocorallia sp. A-T 12471 TaxID=3089813 RepID=UPI0029D40D39|nr:tannase/feruloyl esterase family alpha/beta hydrolase [Actinocorallia sp. A-T 12471]MDX6744225.1 tannase/feruloyl esterase family alpha/beta hydrolase [Actinocorallia sp. A-T 12471]